jgi:thiol-disulfide isomerase/thioredoxin
MKKSITFLLALFISMASIAQEKKSLTIGDAAPEVQYSKWLKGVPFKPDQKDMVYVYEFWATWCGPCIANMPHLSELARKYKGKAQVVAVDIWEKTKDQPYESAIPAVERFVNASGDRMDFNVIMDNNAQHMGNNWMRAADQDGIPATIVIKNGVIQWIGHPSDLEGRLDSLVNGTFDLVAFKNKYEKKQQAYHARNAKEDRIFKAVKVAMDAGDLNQLAKTIEEGVKEDPKLKATLQSNMFYALLTKKSSQEALVYAEEMVKEFPSYKLSLAMMVLEQKNLDKGSYLKAIEWVKSNDYMNSMLLAILSDGYVKVGDTKNALAAMEKAVVEGEKELKGETYKGRIFDYTVDDYRAKVKALKSKL